MKLRPRYERLSATEIEQDVRLGSIARRLLDCDTNGAVAYDLAVQMQKSAHARGLLSRKGIAHPLREFLSDTFGTSFLERHGIHLPDKSIFYGRLRRGEPIGNPMVGTVLALALLGEDFHLRTVESTPLAEKDLSAPPTAPKRVRPDYVSHAESTGTVKLGNRLLSSTEFTHHCRALLLNHIQKHPGAPRKSIVDKLTPPVRKWLRGRDSDFLNQALPRRSRTQVAATVRSVSHWERYDHSLAAHMRRQHIALWGAQCHRLFRVSARLLIANHPSATVVNFKRDPVPQSIKALQELEETVPAFAKRVLCHLWVSNGRYPDFQVAANRANELSDDEVKAERAKARRQSRKKWNFEN
ncbi:hypothetical protein E5S69_14605 [Cupriavidus necator]|uniref:hypothetical protein n=1 Tax=Cupriavidus necator TaxID=106590 RepID=UPI00149002BF|nr:hypothetical protein [Cupriavidus necator]NOV24738.1 hypothetical protein [Cupriavidus necator]